MPTITFSMRLFERGEFLSYNAAFLASISNMLLKGSGKENYSNIHYVKMTAVELLEDGGWSSLAQPLIRDK